MKLIYKLKSFKKGLALVDVLKLDEGEVYPVDGKFIYLTQDEFNQLDRQVITDARGLIK